MDEIRGKIKEDAERQKIIFEDLLSRGVETFFVKYRENVSKIVWYSCYIILRENKYFIEPFEGNGCGESIELNWFKIVEIDEHKGSKK